MNLAQPDQSTMVLKVAGGHNCWLVERAVLRRHSHHLDQELGRRRVRGRRRRSSCRRRSIKDVGSSKTFPATANDNGAASFAQTIYPLLSQFCSRCHSANATTPQSPFFASSDVDEAYANAQAKINLDTPDLSRFYVRLHDECHNCWIPSGGTAVSCPQSSAIMLAAIQAFVDGIVPTQVDPALQLSQGTDSL